MTKVYVGAVGLELCLNTEKSLAGVTLMKIKVLKPDGSRAEWPASQYDATSIFYVTADGDLGDSGEYVFQPYVEWGPASKHLGESVSLRVYGEFE